MNGPPQRQRHPRRSRRSARSLTRWRLGSGAKALIEKLMGSNDPADQARMTAQARLIEAYEHARWPRRAPSLPDLLAYLMDQHGLSRADLVPLLGTPSRVSEVLTG